MSIEAGVWVRSVIDITTLDGEKVPRGTAGMVVGYQGQRVLVGVEDAETGAKWVFDANPWEVMRKPLTGPRPSPTLRGGSGRSPGDV